MKKWFRNKLMLVIILIAILLALPKLLSYKVEEKYLAVANSVSTPSFQVKVLDYRRHWFCSDATLLITVNRSALQANNTVLPSGWQLTVQQHIMHGPVMLVSSDMGDGKRILFGQAFVSSKILQPSIAGQLTSLIKYDGTVISNSNIPLINYYLPQQAMQITLTGITANAELSADLTQVNGSAAIKQVVAQAKDAQLTLQNITSTANSSKQNGLWLGKRNMNIEHILFSMNNKPQGDIQVLSLQSNSDIKQNKMFGSVDIVVNMLNIGNLHLGPHELAISIQNLDVPSMLKIMNMPTDSLMQGQPLSIPRYAQTFMELLAKGFNLNFNKLAISTPWGQALANGTVVLLPQSTSLQINPGNTFAPNIANQVEASFNVQLPVSLVNIGLTQYYQRQLNKAVQQDQPMAASASSPEMLNPQQLAEQHIKQYLANGWLIEQDNTYKFNISYKNQQLLINNKPYVASQFESPVVNPNTQPVSTTTPEKVTAAIPEEKNEKAADDSKQKDATH